ncbi:phosphoribosylamine--glycine ligase [Sphingomonas quercus]|uniref:Phosphoribosylamine--glycine ligase n=1 Tax=Sphingomonas quercus TaxID=2842451 RepID=A0ABS6BFH5_9SPHN|nr:phosphoribosylamine--glycine ligase [Sphingomonas quercus]MBU3077039.1 phosphoribosylamine--glycine ligase [Sphingomonas quercus]
MKILLIGSGGREDALAWKLSQSPLLTTLYAAPGNAGICGRAECVAVDVTDHAAVLAFARDKAIDLVVIGPEQPLVDGLADTLRGAGVRVFGPSAAAAQLEGSKGFTKDLCTRAGIPTAAYARFDGAAAALADMDRFGLPLVVKADGLAAGKGVVIAENRGEAEAAIRAVDGPMVLEAFLTGEEASFFAIADGTDVIAFGSAQDHKRVGEGDTGPNTGGMGAYSPARVLTPALEARVMDEIVRPTVRAMADAGTPFQGVLFAGLMLTADGPQLIEYNARFGDPECQVLMSRLDSDLLPLLIAAADGRLGEVSPRWSDDVALTVVMAAEGYPGTPRTGTVIRGVPAEGEATRTFIAGAKRDAQGNLVASGGRVLCVTARAKDVTEARARAYAVVDAIDWPEGFCRRDIGWREAAREHASGR